jgi:hypothetical protein
MDKNNLGKFEDIKLSHLNCTHKEANHLVWVKNRKKTIIYIIISIMVILFFLDLSLHDDTFLGLLYYVITICVLFPLAYFIRMRDLSHNFFMQKLAEDNNFLYQKEISRDEISLYFPKFGKCCLKNIITGFFYGYKTRFFYNDIFTNNARHVLTMMEVSLGDIDCAHIFLKPREGRKSRIKEEEKNDTNITLDAELNRNYKLTAKKWYNTKVLRILNKEVLRPWFEGNEKNDTDIILDAEFDRDYKLIATKGYNIEALRIFNKEVLRLIKESDCNLRVKIKKDRLYIYWIRDIYKKEALYNMFQVAGAVIKSIEPVMKRMKGDFDSLHPYFRKS